eukprot:8800704-Pyramimonas_sp.AAC.1
MVALLRGGLRDDVLSRGVGIGSGSSALRRSAPRVGRGGADRALRLGLGGRPLPSDDLDLACSSTAPGPRAARPPLLRTSRTRALRVSAL